MSKTPSSERTIRGQQQGVQSTPDPGEASLTAGVLTPREHEVIALLAEGLPNKLIAQRLGISHTTAKSYVSRILAKFHLDNRSQAALHYLRQNKTQIFEESAKLAKTSLEMIPKNLWLSQPYPDRTKGAYICRIENVRYVISPVLAASGHKYTDDLMYSSINWRSTLEGAVSTISKMTQDAHETAVAAGEPVQFVVEVTPAGEVRVGEVTAKKADPEETDPGAAIAADRLDAVLARARKRGERRAAEILDGPEMLNSDTVAERLGVSRETVNRMRQRGELLGLKGARRSVRYPDWQLLPPNQLPAPRLPELFRALGEPWAVYRFLLQKHPELGGQRALDALRDGHGDAVVQLAGAVAGGVIS